MIVQPPLTKSQTHRLITSKPPVPGQPPSPPQLQTPNFKPQASIPQTSPFTTQHNTTALQLTNIFLTSLVKSSLIHITLLVRAQERIRAYVDL
ncbi:predicted protein [Botrytis cinerea T4]|uniref:Uncharacterized protein n=1 Tax=Botryotinia fuckeliana (strain T4) TaxID=999810 RepID=G2Y6Y8_BOTF4|nr:predicted protein [Botrytis cinerea T4]